MLGQRFKRSSLTDITPEEQPLSLEVVLTKSGRARHKRASLPNLASPAPNRLSQSLKEWESSVRERDRREREGRSQGGVGAIDPGAAGGSMVPTAEGAMAPTALTSRA